jgi:hypothetical protein
MGKVYLLLCMDLLCSNVDARTLYPRQSFVAFASNSKEELVVDQVHQFDDDEQKLILPHLIKMVLVGDPYIIIMVLTSLDSKVPLLKEVVVDSFFSSEHPHGFVV